MKQSILFFTSLLFIFFTFAAFSNYDEAYEAYENKNWLKSKKICEKSIEDIRCENLLGLLYLKGQGVSLDYDKALYYFKKASSKGNKQAYKNLAWMYAAGSGIEKNLEEASRLLELSEKVIEPTRLNVKKNNIDIKSLKNINKNIAVFRSYFSEYLKLQFLLNYYDFRTDIYKIDIVSIDSKLKNLEMNIDIKNEDLIQLKKQINKEISFTLRLLELSINNESLEIYKEISKIYSKLKNMEP